MNSRYYLLITAVLAGCGGANSNPGGAAVAPVNEATASVNGNSYDVLFKRGTTWLFDGKLTQSYFAMDNEPEAVDGQIIETVSGRMSCTIATVDLEGAATIAELRCEEADDSELDAYTLGAYFARTPAGLWLTTDRPSEASLTPESMALAAVPVEHHEEFEESEYSGGWSVEAKLSPEGNWCVATASWAGDDSITRFCLDPVRGIVSGEYGFGGGITTSLKVTLSK